MPEWYARVMDNHGVWLQVDEHLEECTAHGCLRIKKQPVEESLKELDVLPGSSPRWNQERAQ